MKIRVIIFESNKKERGYDPEKLEFTGNYALETMINKLLTKYYGMKIASLVEDLLRDRLSGSDKR